MEPQVSPPMPQATIAKASIWKIVAIVSAIVVTVGLGTGAYLVFTNKDSAIYQAIFGKASESEGDGSFDEKVDVDDQDQATGDDEKDPYEGWKTYTEEECDVTFKYPSDWSLNVVSGAEYGDANVSKGNYVWNLYFDPFVTGGGFGYMLGEPVPPSSTTNSTVTPDAYTATMVTQYISRSDLISAYDASIVTTFNIGEDTWEGTVLFSDPQNMLLGFGPGEMYTNTQCDWFGVSYLYDYQKADRSDLPVRGDAVLVEMLGVMDMITNSIEL